MQKDARWGLKALGGAGLIGAAALMGSTMLTSPAAAQSMEELKAQIDRLQAQVDGLEQRQAAPVQAVTGGDKPGTYKLPGSDTSVQLGGYTKLDMLYDVKSDNGNSFNVSAIPNSDSNVAGRDGHFQMHARQSRIWLKTSTPTDLGEVRTHIEFDFFGSDGNELFSNSHNIRLRHAYGTMGGLLLGQTNTNFASLIAYPETLDFFGPVGMPFQRVAQIRYTFAPTAGLSVSFSAENPETTGYDDATGNQIAETAGGNGFDIFPDITGAVQYSTGPFTMRFSAIGKYLNYDDGTNDDSAFGWGLQGSANVDIGQFRMFGAVHGGDGIGRHMLFTNGYDATWDGSDLEPNMQWGLTGGAGIKYNDFLRSSFNYSRVDAEDRDTPATDVLGTTVQVFHGNLIWAPVPRVKMGIEGIYGHEELASGKTDYQVRIHAGAQFSF